MKHAKPPTSSTNLAKVYRRLKELVAKHEVDLVGTTPPPPGVSTAERAKLLADLRNVIDKLFEAVVIRLDVGSNAVQIFQTINTRGLGLSEVDLVRSSLFVGIKDLAHADKLHRLFWEPIEQRLPERQTEDFLRTDLIQLGRSTTARSVYLNYQAEYGKSLHDAIGVESVLKDLSQRSLAYRGVTLDTEGVGRKGKTNVDRVLRAKQDLFAWGHLPSAPFILEAELARRAGAPTSDVLEFLETLLSFLVRRFICEIPPNDLRSIFTRLMATYRIAHPKPAVVDHLLLRSELQQKGSRWPDDAFVKARGVTTPLYDRGTRQSFIILRRLAESMEKPEGFPDMQLGKGPSDYSVEHVLPAGGSLPGKWRSDLTTWGERDPDKVWGEWRHTIGNLTLTIYNSGLGTKSLAEKAAILAAHSSLKVNEAVVTATKWDARTIRARADELVALLCKVWPGP